MVRKYGTPSIGMLTEAKEKNQVKLELDAYFDQLMLTTTNTYFKVSIDNMWMYIINPAMLKTELYMLQGELDQGSKSIYLEETEARFCFQKDFIKEYIDTIAHYQAWYQFITKDHGQKVDELVFPQSSESKCCLVWLTQANFVPHGYMWKMYHFVNIMLKVKFQVSLVENKQSYVI